MSRHGEPDPGADDAVPYHSGSEAADGSGLHETPADGSEVDKGSRQRVPGPEPVLRLSPLSMVTAPTKTLKGFIVPIGVAVVVGDFNPWVLGGAAVALVAMVTTGLFTYATFRYQVGAERLEIRRGLVARSRRTIPLDRIRGVDITATPLHRLLGLAVVKVEAAAGGDKEEEGTLDAVTLVEAERLRGVLLHRRAVLRGDVHHSGPGTDELTVPAPPEDGAQKATPRGTGQAMPDRFETVYFVMPTRWYFYALLSLGYLVTPFVALAAALGVASQVVSEAGVTEEAIGWLAVRETALVIGVGIAVLMALLLLMPVFAVVSYAITHWDFTLRRREGSLVAERGLLTRRSVTLEYRRIRGYEILDSPLERPRRAVRLRAVMTGLGDTATRAMLLPIGARDKVAHVIEEALEPYRGTLLPHPRAALGRRLARAVVPFAVLAAIAWVSGLEALAGVLGVVALLGIPLGVDRYRSLGHGFDGHQVSVRSGSLSREQAVVGRDAIIGWRWSQSLFQRRTGLVNVRLAVGAGNGGYTAFDAGFDESVGFVGSVTPDVVRPFLVRSDNVPHRKANEDEEAPDDEGGFGPR